MASSLEEFAIVKRPYLVVLHPLRSDRRVLLVDPRIVGKVCYIVVTARTTNSGLLPSKELGAFSRKAYEIAPEVTGHGLPLIKGEAYNRVYDQPYGSR
jgi:hypothetical protein